MGERLTQDVLRGDKRSKHDICYCQVHKKIVDGNSEEVKKWIINNWLLFLLSSVIFDQKSNDVRKSWNIMI